MQFKEFLDILHGGLAEPDEDRPSFLCRLCTLSLKFEHDEDDDDRNIPFALKPSMAAKVMSGNKSFPAPEARKFSKFYCEDNLILAIQDLSDLTKETMAKKLFSYGLKCDSETIAETCAQLFGEFIELAKDGIKERFFDFNEGTEENGVIKPSLPTVTGIYNYSTQTITSTSNRSVQLINPITPPNEPTSTEKTYIRALGDIYSEKLEKTLSDNFYTELTPRLQKHYTRQRRNFYKAETVRCQVREAFYNGDQEFSELKNEIFEGVEEVFEDEYQNGYERCKAVLNQAVNVIPGRSMIKNVNDNVGSAEKMGICHMLVNDQKIISWVDIDDENNE